MPNLVESRDAFAQALLELGEENPNVTVLTADLATSTKVGVFAKRFPNRFIDVGIAEQNMISIAAGLATCGKIPIVSTLAVFASERVCNQVMISVAYPKLNVKIVGTHGGISVGKDGATHQSICDLAIMRSIPGMVVMAPYANVETRKCVKAAANYVGPVYIRLGREPVPEIFDETYDFHIGKAVVLKDGGDATIVANGLMIHEALKAYEKLLLEGIKTEVIDLHTIKPIDVNTISKAARETGGIVTAEEHNIYGGVGSAVAEVVVENYPVPMIRVGLKDTFGESGVPYDLLKKYGLVDINIVDAVKSIIEKKKR